MLKLISSEVPSVDLSVLQPDWEWLSGDLAFVKSNFEKISFWMPRADWFWDVTIQFEIGGDFKFGWGRRLDKHPKFHYACKFKILKFL